MARWGGFVVVVLLALPLRAAQYDPKVAWERFKTPHFTLVYPAAVAVTAQKAARYAEEAYRILAPKYQWKPLGRTTVVLTDVHDQANGLATVLPYNTLFLRLAPPDAHGALANYDEWLRLLLLHELTHILHMDQARGVMRLPRAVLGKVISPNGLMPGWMREGIAVHEETVNTQAGRNRGSYADMLLRGEVAQGRWPKISQADGLGWRWPGFLPPYMYGGKFIEWLATTYGESTIAEFQKRSSRNLFFFMHNHLAKTIWHKSFYQLWRQWRDETSMQYAAQIAAVQARGESPAQVVTDDGMVLSALGLSADGRHLVYTTTSPHRANQIRWRSLVDGAEQVIRAKQAAGSASVDAAGTRVAYSAPGAHKRYNFFSDIYLYDVATKRLTQVTRGRRAADPAFSPDGKELLYVVEARGTQQLMRADVSGANERPVPIAAPQGTRFARPQWAPNGTMIAVSSHQGATQDLYLYSSAGALVQQITRDAALDTSPAWDHTGRYLYFASDRTGISNIYRYDTQRRSIEQVTNVVTGAFEPKPAPDGTTLYVQYYNGNGYDVRRMTLPAKPFAVSTPAKAGPNAPAVVATGEAAPAGNMPPRKYSAFGPQLLVPRFIVPGVIASGSTVILSATTGGNDPLRWHNWQGGVTYRLDAPYLGYFFGYTYNRYRPVWSMGVLNYAVDFGNFNLVDATTGAIVGTEHIFEKRLRGYAGMTYPFNSQSVSLSYFMEDRKILPDLANTFTLGRFAGLSASYGWGKLEQYPASISLEKGHRLMMNVTATDKMFGSDEPNEQRIFSGELRHFFPLPWKHHVIAARIKGGIATGDPLTQGTFSFGGALGEGAFAGGGGFYYFPFRGLPVAALSRTRTALASVEYRFPLFSPQRGLGTTPIYLQNAHAALFADYGNAWNGDEGTGSWPLENFMLSAGAELRGDFILGHGLPVAGRVGYGIVIHNRDRANAFTDPLLKTSAKYGSLIAQIGTSF